METKRNDENTIDLIDLFFYLKKKIWIIAISAAAFLLAGLIVSSLFMTPQYSASTRIFILNRSNDSQILVSDLQLSNQFINDYRELITGRNVTKEVIDQLGVKLTPAQLSKKIKTEAPSNTRFLEITVTDPNPYTAASLANAVRDVAAKQIKEIMGVDSVQVVYAAEVPTSPSSPNVGKNTVIACILGVVLAVGVLTVIYVLDDTIKTEEDVDRYLGLGVLGVIPATDELESGTTRKKKTHSITGQRKRA